MENLIDDNGILEVPVDPKYAPDPRGYGVYCFEKMKEYSNNVAQICTETNKSETYRNLLLRSVRVALHIKSLGIRDGDIISLCTDTHMDTCIPFWAALFSGVIVANLDPSLSKNDLVYLTDQVQPKLIFSIPECVEILESVIDQLNLDTKLVVIGETDCHMSFNDFLKPHEDEECFQPMVVERIFDTLMIYFSSATTGLSKGICITHYAALYFGNNLKEIVNASTVLFYSNPYWVSFGFFLTPAVLSGGKRIIRKKFDKNQVLQLIEDYKITFLFLSSATASEIASNTENRKMFDTSSLHTIFIGGSVCADEYIKKLRKIFFSTFITQSYGMTEIASLFSSFIPVQDAHLTLKHTNSCGKMLSGAICKVVDIETRKVLGKNEKGELLIKTNRIMKGYYNDPINTTKVFDEDGFFCTGDIVYYDEDYCFYVVDRIKETFKYKSWQIMPAELERIILQHPGVKEVLVVGYPNQEDGDHPMAVIVLQDNVNISEDDIIAYFDERNDDDRKKLRAGVTFVKSFPKTATGKYSRMKLRSMIINNEI